MIKSRCNFFLFIFMTLKMHCTTFFDRSKKLTY